MDSQIRIAPLVFGMAFIAIGVIALTGTGNDVDIDTAWLWVTGFATIGLAGLISVIGAIIQRD